MGVEQTVFDYHDIVPQPTWAERNLPTFLGLARRMGYFLPDTMPREYPAQMTMNMPQIPWSVSSHPLLTLFDMVYQAANQMVFKPGEERTLKLRLDRGSFWSVTNVPYHPDDSSFVGDAMNNIIAISSCAAEWFEQKGYAITNTEIGLDTFNLTMQRA